MLNFFKKYVLKWLIFNGLLAVCLVGAAYGITGAKNVANLLFTVMVLGIVVATMAIGKKTDTRDDTIKRHVEVYKFGRNLIARGKAWLNIDTGVDTALAIYCAYMGWFWWRASCLRRLAQHERFTSRRAMCRASWPGWGCRSRK